MVHHAVNDIVTSFWTPSWCTVFVICRFLLQSLEDLDSSLRKLNSRLFVIRGQPTDVFPRLFKVTWIRFKYTPKGAPNICCASLMLYFVYSLFSRSGKSLVSPMSTTLSPLGKSEMQPLRSWPPRLESRWQCASPTHSMTWTSKL